VQCLYCGSKFWSLWKQSDGDFCSTEHREQYDELLRRAFGHARRIPESLKPKVQQVAASDSGHLAGVVWKTTPGYVKNVAVLVALVGVIGVARSNETLGVVARGYLISAVEALHQRVKNPLDFHFGEDFQLDSEQWLGSMKGWASDEGGFVRPGRLAIYRPSVSMSNYRVEFSAQIERQGLGWAFRAADPQNYYAMKFTVIDPGPRPLMSVVRYPVVDGKKGQRIDVPIRAMVHNNTAYRVRLDVQGRNFTTSLEGEVIDSWSDDRLKAGGIGFFSENGEKARLYSMKIWNYDDFLGQCREFLTPAFFAPVFLLP
jgi:hypothetical protein